MRITTTKYNALAPLARCLLLITALKTKSGHQSTFISVISQIDRRLPSGISLGRARLAEIKKEFIHLKKEGWIEYTGRGLEAKLNPEIDDFKLLKMAHLVEPIFFERIAEMIRSNYQAYTWGYYRHDTNSDDYFIRDFKIAVVTDDLIAYNRAMQNLDTKLRHYEIPSLVKMYQDFEEKLNDFSEEGYFQYIGKQILEVRLSEILFISLVDLTEVEHIFPTVESTLEELFKDSDKLIFQKLFDNYTTLLLCRGAFSKCWTLCEKYQSYQLIDLFKGLQMLFQGQYEVADQHFLKGYSAYQKVGNRSLRHYPEVQPNIFYFLSRARQLGRHFGILENGIKHYADKGYSTVTINMELVDVIYKFANNKLSSAKQAYELIGVISPMDSLLMGWLGFWLEMTPSKEILSVVKKTYTLAKNNGFQWMEMETASILAQFQRNSRTNYEEIAKNLATKLGAVSLLELMPKVEKWERTLMGLEGVLKVTDGKEEATQIQKSQNMVILLDLDGKKPELEIKLQTIAKKGGWTSGRKAKITDLQLYGKQYGTNEELRIIESMSYYQTDGKEESFSDFYYNSDYLFKNLIGATNIFHLKNPKIQLEIVEEAPRVVIEELASHFNVQANHLPYKDGVNFFKISPTTYKLVDYTNRQFQMLSFFSGEKVVFPKSVSHRLVDVVEELKKVVKVDSLLEKDVSDLKLVEGDTTPHVHLLPIGQAFQMEIFAKPYETSIQYFHPGEGRQMLLDSIDGENCRIERDLKNESKQAKAVIKFLKPPKKTKVSDFIWALDDPEDCLKVLSALHPLRQEAKVVVEWPKGEKFKLLGALNSSQLELRISKGKDYWFSLDGEVRVNEHLVFSLQKLLELAGNSHKGYIEISDGQFLSLTKKFQKQLATAKGVLQKNKKNELEFHNLAGLAMEDLFAEASAVEMDDLWKEQQQKLTKAKKIRPKVSKQFKADLRPYQGDGFKWMMQLAEWGVGGCLADDMGLGKTIQGLAVLVSRQAKGPALVVAPASVCRNWLRETEKFAPSLNPILLGLTNREDTIKSLHKKDLLIVTYGLLHTQIDNLKEVNFSTIILDEAQAIKNYDTKRFKAATQLQGAFKLATTGTPVENHLGELWSLFQFINPGLLGTKKQFANRFGVPIKNGEKGPLEQLKTLVQPFILRRRKSQVLKDLPAKTEIIYNVEMPDDERAFYEAARRNAVQKLESELDEQKGGAQHLMILAEITRMRRACCHPSLVDAKTTLPGAKLEAFKEIMHDLRENGHRALVFSQFVGYLKIVENWIQKEEIPYQYLDGSTPLKKREIAVNDFQKGEGDLFLISLKAGGVGLNLTAADYVIILDPWWNPAVEDQAADRAHRIGQQKPVTVYRLVIENTIEEKIVQLHSQKRDLADSLLQGTEYSTKITAKDLLKILKNER
jgi:superfamily II DNA or RNA helicase